MISFKEMIKDVVISDIPIAHQQNIQELLKRLNVIRTEWGKPMIVTSGYRTMQDHLRIYHRKGVPAEKVPMKSNHLSGRACDISDPDGLLKEWLKENVGILEDLGLWCEDFNHTKTWVHFQSVPPKSGKRFFIP